MSKKNYLEELRNQADWNKAHGLPVTSTAPAATTTEEKKEADNNTGSTPGNVPGNTGGNGIVGSTGGGYTGGSAGGSGGIYTAPNGATYVSGTLDGIDWTAEWQNAIASGADYDTLLDIYNNRLGKTMQGGYQQYYGDAVQQAMEAYLQQNNPNGGNAAIQQQLADLQATIQELQNMDFSYEGSPWDDTLARLAQEAIDFNYEDWTQSDQYSSLADRYGYQGKLSMQDILGQISSRTGGLASSYATTVAQQQYNDYMAQLEEVARKQWAGEKSNLLENAQLAQSMSQMEYQRYMDALAARQGGLSDAMSGMYDILNAQISMDNTSYNRGQNSRAEAQDRIYEYLVNQGGAFSDLDASLISQSGYTTSELKAMEAMAAQRANAGTSAGTVQESAYKPVLTASQVMDALNGGIVNDSTKQAYEYYYGQPWGRDAAGLIDDTPGQIYTPDNLPKSMENELTRAESAANADVRIVNVLKKYVENGGITEDQAVEVARKRWGINL